MPLVVDAFNVLHVTGVLPPDLAGLDLDGLADLIETTRFYRDETWIVCDGPQRADGPHRRERVWFSWAGRGAKADDLIIGLVRRSSSPRRMTVVTSDRGIVKEVRRRGAETWTSEEFLERIVADRRHARPSPRSAPASLRETVPLAEPEVRAWLKTFGLVEEMATIAPSTVPKASRPHPVEAPPPAPRKTPQRLNGPIDDPLFFAGIDLASLLVGTPPPRDEPRALRRTRRDRQR